MALSLLSSKRNFWQKFEERVLEVINLAISKFLLIDKLPREENELNRLFFFCLVEANYELQKKNKGLESPPSYEANNQPYFGDLERASRESKRPDFQWLITDTTNTDPRSSSKQFVLECKRLGLPAGTWILNENYFNHGIVRFVSAEHGYAKGVESAAMLGYVQNMSEDNIVKEINKLLTLGGYSNMVLDKSEAFKSILNHILKTEFNDQKLKLIHFWINVAHKYP